MTKSTDFAVRLAFDPFIVRLFNQVLNQHCPSMTKDEARVWLEDCEGVRRVNFWPEHTVTVWMTWEPRPTQEQVKEVRAMLKKIVPAGIRTRVMGVLARYWPSVWHRYISDQFTKRHLENLEWELFHGR